MKTMPKAVLFDCYGTLLRIARPSGVTRRYATLAKDAAGPSPLTGRTTLEDALKARGIDAAIAEAVGRDALLEADSVEPIGDALEMVERMLATGIRVAVVSNLSVEYAAPIRRLLPDVPLVLSFEAGAAKPDPAIYRSAMDRLGVGAGETAMVGDSRRCDHDGPMALGIRSIQLGEGKDGIERADDVSGAMRLIGLAQGHRP